MTDERTQTGTATADASRARRLRDALLALALVAGLGLSAVLSHRLASARVPLAATVDADELYLSPEAARRMSLGFNGLVADWYWLRSLQYIGRKVLSHEGDLQLDDLSPLGLKQLSPLLEQSTALDPEFMAAYEFGAVVLPAVDEEAAIRLIKKGIRENPGAWRLHHHLGYIHWRRGQFREAADTYLEGSRVAGAPEWMSIMAGQMEVSGGSRDLARSIYTRMRDEADDEKVKRLAELRIAQVDSLDERDSLRRALAEFRSRAGRCPRDWREVSALVRAARLRTDNASAPVDPSGTPYMLDTAACEVRLSPDSPIPVK
jgi:hypothetical protein